MTELKLPENLTNELLTEILNNEEYGWPKVRYFNDALLHRGIIEFFTTDNRTQEVNAYELMFDIEEYFHNKGILCTMYKSINKSRDLYIIDLTIFEPRNDIKIEGSDKFEALVNAYNYIKGQ